MFLLRLLDRADEVMGLEWLMTVLRTMSEAEMRG
jgi:hypothetical protein